MENHTQNLCRVCFEVGHFHISGYEVNIQEKNISIGVMMKRFSDIEVTDENAPELICENCTHDLVQSYLFTEKILEADAKILRLSQLQEEHKIAYEPELLQTQNVEEESVNQKMEADEVDQSIVVYNMENQKIEVLSEEEADVFEEDQYDLIEESAESNIADEMYIDSEMSADENNEKSSTVELETISSHDINPSEGESVAHLNPFESELERVNEYRKKYQRRNKADNEIDKNGSFVITQFSCSTTAPAMHRHTNAEDNDEVTLSDVRIMNYETVEVKAGNIDVLNQGRQSELPIDESRVYLCQYCPRAFSSSSFLVAHVRKTHGCKFCASLFEKAKDLYAHIREAHSKFECVVCGKEFASNSNMRNHLKIVHKVKVPANVSLISYKKQSEIEETI